MNTYNYNEQVGVLITVVITPTVDVGNQYDIISLTLNSSDIICDINVDNITVVLPTVLISVVKVGSRAKSC